MPVNGDAARRDMLVGRMSRCLAADITVKEWCALNKVAESRARASGWPTSARRARALFPCLCRAGNEQKGL